MVCNISSQKSGSNWLDRLRSSKGFAVADQANLEQFLANQTPNGSETGERGNNNNTGSESSSNSIRSVDEPVVRTPAALDTSGDTVEMCNVVSNVLSELFCMGESTCFPNFNVKKGQRKQTNPRFCASSVINNAVGSPMSDDNSRVGIKDSKVKLLEQGHDLKSAEEESKSHADLAGFSRTEVMVIDTSCAPWKFEKLLFRKKNVWKVRNRKSKTINSGKKKRKADVEDENVGGKKKHKVLSGLTDGCGSSKDAKGVSKFPVNEKLRLNDKSEETCKRTSDFIGQASKKRQGDLKLKKASSSVVLIKSIPTSKRNGTSTAKISLKPSQR